MDMRHHMSSSLFISHMFNDLYTKQYLWRGGKGEGGRWESLSVTLKT
jgi:hypothetical protein